MNNYTIITMLMHIQSYKSGNYQKSNEYKYFVPSKINHEWELTPKLVNLASDASRQLGELNAYSILVPNIDLYISMHVAKEAETSSKIEGTRTNIEEVFAEIQDIDPEKRDDWQEVINYIESTNLAIEGLHTLPISSRLIKNVHKKLLAGVRGKNKNPGEFRHSQNWIGGATINDAHFIPPDYSLIPELITDLEMFIHNKDLYVPDIIKIGIIHYQFETIHPFLDGNGRIGRLLIIIYLLEKGILTKPVLYLSQYFEKHRSLYYENLDRARIGNNMEQWLNFFLVAISETSKKGVATLKSILELNNRLEDIIHQKLGKKAANAKRLIMKMYERPIINAKVASKLLGINSLTAQRLINDLVSLKILDEQTGFKRNREYVFREYINLFLG